MGNNGNDFVVRCSGNKQPLLKHFTTYLAQLGGIRVESTDRFIETEGAVQFEATVQTGSFGRVRVYDAWALRGGKIAIHFTGLLAPPPTGGTAAASAQVIQRYYETANAGDWKAWLTLFDDKIVGDEQIAGHFEGLDPLRGAGDAISKGYSKFQMRPQQIIINGEEVAVVWRCEAVNAHGVPIAYPGDPNRPVVGANYFRIVAGKIVAMRTIHDVIPFQPFVQGSCPYKPA
jgi:hypothetical protein